MPAHDTPTGTPVEPGTGAEPEDIAVDPAVIAAEPEDTAAEPDAPSVTAVAGARNSWRTALFGLLPVVGLALVFLRDAFDRLGRPVNPVVLAIVGFGIALVGAFVAVRKATADSTSPFVRRYGNLAAVAVIAAVGLVIMVVPAPTPGKVLRRLDGDANVAVLDFIGAGDGAPAHGDLVGDLLVEGLDDVTAGDVEIDAENYGDEGDGVFLDEGVRDDWANEFGTDVNAQLIVAGTVDRSRAPVVALWPMVYVRADAIPDSPEMAGWLPAAAPIVTTLDLEGGFGPSERARLARELATVVTEIVSLAVASDEINNGRPDAAAARLDELATSTSVLISPELVAVYRGTAALLEAQAATDDERLAAIDRATAEFGRFAPSSSRARFGLLEAGLARAFAEGCRPGGASSEALDQLATDFGVLRADDELPTLVRARAHLGELRVLACGITAGSVPRSRRTELRDGADALAEELLPDDGGDDRAAQVVVSRALALWPEVVLATGDAASRGAARERLERSARLEPRVERQATTRAELALLLAFECDEPGALAELAIARELYEQAVALGRVAPDDADLPELVAGDIRSIIDDCPG